MLKEILVSHQELDGGESIWLKIDNYFHWSRFGSEKIAFDVISKGDMEEEGLTVIPQIPENFIQASTLEKSPEKII